MHWELIDKVNLPSGLPGNRSRGLGHDQSGGIAECGTRSDDICIKFDFLLGCQVARLSN